MGLGPIPWTDIVCYADRYKLEEDIVEAFIDIIREMDTAFLQWQANDTKRKEELNAPKKHRRK